jgi:hypothetical protein
LFSLEDNSEAAPSNLFHQAIPADSVAGGGRFGLWIKGRTFGRWHIIGSEGIIVLRQAWFEHAAKAMTPGRSARNIRAAARACF